LLLDLLIFSPGLQCTQCGLTIDKLQKNKCIVVSSSSSPYLTSFFPLHLWKASTRWVNHSGL